jgi:hypothetical protein
MIKSVNITNHRGETLKLEPRSPEKSGFFIRNIDGLGPAKGIINTTEVLSADGSFYNSSRIASRNVIFDLGFYNYGQDTIEIIRQNTYRFFPMKRPITIEVETENRFGSAIGYVESNEPNIFSKEEGAIISVICPSAFWEERSLVQTFFSGVEPNFEFPWENPSLTESLIEFGHVFIDTAHSVIYTGDEPTGVEVYVNFLGAVTDLTIINATLGQNMAINSAKIFSQLGSGITAGDIIHINTNKGYKHIHLIRGGVEYNILNALSTLAQWFTIEKGDNVFTYTAATGLSNVQLMVQHRVIYKGL